MTETEYTAPEILPLTEALPAFWEAWQSPEETDKSYGTAQLLENWESHKHIIQDLYAYYMYGPMPDTSEETLTYTLEAPVVTEVTPDETYPDNNTPFRVRNAPFRVRNAPFRVRRINGTIHVTNNTGKGSFPIIITLPMTEPNSMPYPVYSEMCWTGGSTPNADYAASRGYAAISWKPTDIAADNLSRDGMFYQLYPYGDTCNQQTGALMAWSWGAGKIIDALEQGMGEELHIDSVNNILTGVSRFGKATAVAGAFDQRIKVVVPTCSGAGGMAYTYLAAREIYRKFGLEDHLNIHIHENNVEPSNDFKVRRGPCPNHAVLAEDMVYLLDYCDVHLLGKTDISSDLNDLKTCAFFEEKNWDNRFDVFK